MKKLLITILICITFFTEAYSQTVESSNAYQIIYEADKEGNRISGSLEDLVEYVQNGNPIRVGWMLKLKPPKEEAFEMHHWTDAGFITTLRGHVFVQIRGIFEQGPMISTPPGVLLVSDTPNSWVGIIGTTGVLNQKFKRNDEMVKMLKKTMTDEQIDKFFKKQETSKVITKWAVLIK